MKKEQIQELKKVLATELRINYIGFYDYRGISKIVEEAKFSKEDLDKVSSFLEGVHMSSLNMIQKRKELDEIIRTLKKDAKGSGEEVTQENVVSTETEVVQQEESLVEQEILPEQQEEILPEQQEETLPEQQEETLPEQQEETLPEQQEETLPEQQEETLPEQQEETLPEQQEETAHGKPSTRTTKPASAKKTRK